MMKQKVMGWQWHQLDHMQIMPALHHLNFYRPCALPDAQQSMSKHWGIKINVVKMKSKRTGWCMGTG